MSEGHSHSPRGVGHERQLGVALVLTAIYLMIEVVAGFLTNSLALLSDAAHMMTDVAALVIALLAIRIGKRPADRKRTFGYARFEILAAAFNAVALFVIAFYILYEAVLRFRQPEEVHTVPMLTVAVIGLIVNGISIRILQSGSGESLNMRGAYLEVLSDLVGSVGVIIAALIIRFTGWQWVDSVLAVLIGLWVLPRTWRLLSESVNVLLEGVPQRMELQKIYDTLAALPGVRTVHDLHVWEVTQGQPSLTAHLVADKEQNADTMVCAAQEAVESFGIEHCTFQVESADMSPEEHAAHPYS